MTITLTLTVTDPCDASAQTNVTVHVVDTKAPVITSSPGSITISAGDNGLGVVPNILGGIVASDTCTPANALVLSQNPSAGASLGLGSYSIVATVKDASGNAATAGVASE